MDTKTPRRLCECCASLDGLHTAADEKCAGLWTCLQCRKAEDRAKAFQRRGPITRLRDLRAEVDATGRDLRLLLVMPAPAGAQ